MGGKCGPTPGLRPPAVREAFAQHRGVYKTRQDKTTKEAEIFEPKEGGKRKIATKDN
jgi:hypothetical protein